MRRLLLAAALAALAACQVDVGGAPCTTPGTTTDCPGGQACGNDRTCSAHAAACLTTRCVPGNVRCDTGTTLLTCTNADAACGSWQPDDCSTRQLVCGTRSGSPACECPANAGPVFAADPASGSATSSVVTPTGAAAPAQCRYKQLVAAIAAASASGAAATVQVYGAGTGPVTFGSTASGEPTYPIDVPAGVTVVGAPAPAGETIILGDGNPVGSIVTVEGTLQGVHVSNVSTTHLGVEMICGAGGSPALQDVIVTGAGAGASLATGVSVAGACGTPGAVLTRVDASGATGAALAVDAATAAPVTVGGGVFHASGVGLQVTGGTLLVQPDSTAGAAQVTGNTGTGILLTGTNPGIDATFTGVQVSGNGGTGLVVYAIPTSSKLSLHGCDVHGNASTAPTVYGPVGSKTNAGGLLLVQSSLASFQLRGNLIYANHGTNVTDEVGFDGTGAWTLGSSADCVAPNAIGCVLGLGNAVRATGGSVDAQYTQWSPYPPTVMGSVTFNPNYCPAFPVTCP